MGDLHLPFKKRQHIIRRGQGRFSGHYIQDLAAQTPPEERAWHMVELQQAEVDDVIAGLNYLESRHFVDAARIAISGCSFGGIQTLLTGELDLGVKALVPFAPGAASWEENPPLRDRLIRSVDLAKAPIFLIRAENDYSLAPSRVLNKEANRKHRNFQSKIYPAFGSTHHEGHGDSARRRPTYGEMWNKENVGMRGVKLG
jgi:dienelactone hydrolase